MESKSQNWWRMGPKVPLDRTPPIRYQNIGRYVGLNELRPSFILCFWFAKPYSGRALLRKESSIVEGSRTEGIVVYAYRTIPRVFKKVRKLENYQDKMLDDCSVFFRRGELLISIGFVSPADDCGFTTIKI